jgi:hypothetical protein
MLINEHVPELRRKPYLAPGEYTGGRTEYFSLFTHCVFMAG